MLRKAIFIQSIFFLAAAVLVISAVALISFIGSQGLQVFRYISPVEFFTATTWNQYANRAEYFSGEASDNEVSDKEAQPSTQPTQPVTSGQLIEPSEPMEGAAENGGGQLIEPSEPMEGAAENGGGQLIEPSEPMEGAAESGGGQLIEPSEPMAGAAESGSGQLIEPSEPMEA